MQERTELLRAVFNKLNAARIAPLLDTICEQAELHPEKTSVLVYTCQRRDRTDVLSTGINSVESRISIHSLEYMSECLNLNAEARSRFMCIEDIAYEGEIIWISVWVNLSVILEYGEKLPA